MNVNINGAKWIHFHDLTDNRGRLTAIEEGEHVPFPIRRIFYVHQVTAGIDRGGHAHRDTDQILTVTYGILKVDLSDGLRSAVYNLDNPGIGLFVPRMIWIRLFDFSPGAVCLVLANTRYDMSKSIRTWNEYLQARSLDLTK